LETVVGDSVAAVTTALLPSAMLGLPVGCAMLLPDNLALVLLYALALL
jgi:hypothetical protein